MTIREHLLRMCIPVSYTHLDVYKRQGNDAFGGDKVTMKTTLGGKGAGLAEMTAAGMPVPQGFTITTDACTQYYADGRQINDDITCLLYTSLRQRKRAATSPKGERLWQFPARSWGSWQSLLALTERVRPLIFQNIQIGRAHV